MSCAENILKLVYGCVMIWTWRLLIFGLPYKSGMNGLPSASRESASPFLLLNLPKLWTLEVFILAHFLVNHKKWNFYLISCLVSLQFFFLGLDKSLVFLHQDRPILYSCICFAYPIIHMYLQWMFGSNKFACFLSFLKFSRSGFVGD